MTAQPAQAELFARCPVDGRTPVADPRVPCDECLAELGPWLREAPATVSADDFTAVLGLGETRVSRILAERRAAVPLPAPPPEKRRNQECWCCERPRVCTPDPDRPEKWICRSCLAIPLTTT